MKGNPLSRILRTRKSSNTILPINPDVSLDDDDEVEDDTFHQSRFQTVRNFFSFHKRNQPNHKSIKLANELFEHNEEDKEDQCKKDDELSNKFMTLKHRLNPQFQPIQLNNHINGNVKDDELKSKFDDYISDVNNYWKSSEDISKIDINFDFDSDLDVPSEQDTNNDNNNNNPYDKSTQFSRTHHPGSSDLSLRVLKSKSSVEPDFEYTTSPAELLRLKRKELDIVPVLDDDEEDHHYDTTNDFTLTTNDEDSPSKTLRLKRSISRLSFHSLNLLFAQT
ncbi:hypothetical protein DFJ63DRAFT_315797 [Scheffersomyces coipomensis]|uniref:uncharacterized protein n=1 Tax=Scheffersomyces coipomensis TaxID=1788519 RepID=UPI00315C4EF4